MTLLLPRHTKGRLTTPDGAYIPYVIIGEAGTPIVVLPGAGDGLSTVDDATLALAWFYRKRIPRHHMLILSRRQPIPLAYSVEQHAEDMVWAMEQLRWGPTILECNSGGGPIGQWIAVQRHDLVHGLILTSTLHYTDEHTRGVIQSWIDLAHGGRWGDLRWSSVYYTFHKTLWLYRLLRPLFSLLREPRYPERLERILSGLLYLDNRDILPRITCPTLVIGGEDDRIIGADIQREMARLIPNSQIQLYPGYGHGNDLENPNYSKEVARFVHKLEFPDEPG